MLLKHELYREAAEAARTVLGLKESTHAWFSLAYDLVATKDATFQDEAIHAYRRVLELNPKSSGAMNNLALLLEERAQFPEATELLERALELEPEDTVVQSNLRRVTWKARAAPLQAAGIDVRFKTNASDEARAVALEYWSRSATGWKVTTKQLQATMGLTAARLRDAANAAAWACSPTRNCVECGAAFVFSDRKEFETYQQFRHSPHSAYGRPYVCGGCHDRYAARVKAEQQDIHTKRVNVIRERFDLSDVPAVKLDTLSLEDAIYLASVTRTGATEDLRFIRPLGKMDDQPGPTPEFSIQMLDHLHRRGILYVHPASDPAAFDWDGEAPTGFAIGQVYWGIPMGGQQLPFGEFIQQVEAKLGAGPSEWPEAWVRDIPELWRTIILQEATRHLLHCLKQHGFEFSPGEKTVLVLRAVLEEYSLAQAWNMIWSRAKDAAAYLVRERVPKAQAANSTITRIKSYAENAKANGWTVRASRRDYDTPMPMVSQVLFSHALHLGWNYQEQLPPPLTGEQTGA
ncbi:tetratricopeptide repeat protein [uncultured Deinococcus sp.]|uniref:tetratricopeptide repeat protein n=1 Tax=uncultured Deinococcus sp. TaxID=158789 RepID=UPI0025F188B5|nr:tetratricopeptide repeat protein [uncultured Deinococcus sp.]